MKEFTCVELERRGAGPEDKFVDIPDELVMHNLALLLLFRPVEASIFGIDAKYVPVVLDKSLDRVDGKLEGDLV